MDLYCHRCPAYTSSSNFGKPNSRNKMPSEKNKGSNYHAYANAWLEVATKAISNVYWELVQTPMDSQTLKELQDINSSILIFKRKHGLTDG